MKKVFSGVAVAALSLGAGCSGTGPPGGRDFGQFALASLQTPCEAVAGLTGEALLAYRQDSLEGTLRYVTAQGETVDPTPLTVELTWPGTPVATCYPAYTADGGGGSAQPRLAIHGVGIRFVTADGRFDETLDATAWLLQVGSTPSPAVLGVTTLGALHGSWEPFPEYQGNQTLLFNVALQGGAGQAGGNVGLSNEDPEELNAAILRSRFAVALFQ